MKILIVDEEPDVVRLISVSFGMQQSNWEILAASDGEEGLTMLERERPALVLLDVGLPDMSGFQVLEQIRLFSDVPVIMLTVHDDELSKADLADLVQAADRAGPHRNVVDHNIRRSLADGQRPRAAERGDLDVLRPHEP